MAAKLAVNRDRKGATFSCEEGVTTNEEFARLVGSLSNQLLELCPVDQHAPGGYTLKTTTNLPLKADLWELFHGKLKRKFKNRTEVDIIFLS